MAFIYFMFGLGVLASDGRYTLRPTSGASGVSGERRGLLFQNILPTGPKDIPCGIRTSVWNVTKGIVG